MSERPVLYADRHPGKPGRWICSGCSVDLFGPKWLCPTPTCKHTLRPTSSGSGETGSASLPNCPLCEHPPIKKHVMGEYAGHDAFFCASGVMCPLTDVEFTADQWQTIAGVQAPQAPAGGAEVSSALDYFGSIVADSSDDDYQDGLRHMAVIRAALAAHPATGEA